MRFYKTSTSVCYRGAVIYSISITSMSTIFFLLNYPRYVKAPHSQTDTHFAFISIDLTSTKNTSSPPQIAILAAVGGLYSLSGATLHGLALRNQRHPNPNSMVIQLLPAILLAAILGIILSLGVTVYGLTKAISGREGGFSRKLCCY